MMPYFVAVFSGRLDDAAGGRVNDGGDTAGLGVKSIHCWHIRYSRIDSLKACEDSIN